MPRSIAIFISLSFLSLAFVGATWALVYRLMPEHRQRQGLRWLLSWSLKGFFLPVLLWAVMNLGISWNLQPFMQQIQASQIAGRNWLLPFARFIGFGLFIVSTYWMAITLGWSLVKARAGLEGEILSDFKALCLTCAIGMCVPAGLIAFLGGWPTAGLAGIALFTPIAAYAPAILRRKKVRPMYARAIGKMKFGKYSEAEWEIINQLEKCEDDFEGWIMLADLYANQFNDLAEAEQTVLEICDQPRTSPSQVSIALHKLAEWYLKLASDPDAARRALQMISDRLPGTHLAHMAQLRIDQLPATSGELREQQLVQPIPMPALSDALDEEDAPAESELDHQKAAEMANVCVERLNQDPNNVAAREKLARLLAERLHKPDLGLDQMTLLLNMPDQPDLKRAEWLGLTAAWQIKYRDDLDAGRKILERLIREFPHSPQAFAARRRLRLMDVAARK